MGLSVTASGIIVMGVFLLVASTFFTLLIDAGGGLGEGVETQASIGLRKIHGSVDIIYAHYNSTQNNLTFIFANNGSLTFYDFPKFDVIVTYTDNATGSPRVVRLEYGRDWNITSILINGGLSTPYGDRGYLDPSEAALVEAALPTPAAPNTPLKLVVATIFGTRDSITITTVS